METELHGRKDTTARGKDARYNHKQRCLMTAIENNDTEEITLLCEDGVNVNHLYNNEMLPVQVSVSKGFCEATTILGHHGASMNSPFYCSSISRHLCFPAYGVCTPLHMACKNGDLKMCNILVTYGADINGTADCHFCCGQTAIAYAYDEYQYECVYWLIAHGANPYITDKFDGCFLHMVVRNKDFRTLYRLLKAGVDFNTHWHNVHVCEPLADTVLAPPYDKTPVERSLRMAKFLVLAECDRVTFMHCGPCQNSFLTVDYSVGKYLHNIGCACAPDSFCDHSLCHLLCTYKNVISQTTRQLLFANNPLQEMCRQQIRDLLCVISSKETLVTILRNIGIPRQIKEFIVFGESVHKRN